MSAGRTTAPGPASAPVLDLRGVSVRRSGATILGPLDWVVGPGDRWVLLGPNGSGKTTLLQVADTTLWPTTGSVAVLGRRLGTVDARELRRRIGFASPALAAALDPRLTPLDVVVSARAGALAPWWAPVSEDDRARAHELLDRLGVDAMAGRPMATLSTGERQRVLIARALLPDPDLLLLDEPAAGLDLGGREDLIGALERLAAQPRPSAVVMVTHHVEEIPAGFGRALVLRAGRIEAVGPTATTLSASTLSRAFGLPLRVERGADGRLHARRDLPASPGPGRRGGD